MNMGIELRSKAREVAIAIDSLVMSPVRWNARLCRTLNSSKYGW